MPELPEVETVRRGLEPVMTGATIERAQVNRPDLRWPFPPHMAGRLTGQRVIGLRRRSKYILADLSGGETLLIHLGMSGRMLISAPTVNAAPGIESRDQGQSLPPGVFHHLHAAPQKHDHVILDMDNGARITFNDARRFGAMDLVPSADWARHPLLAGLGPEPLGNSFDGDYLAQRLRGRSMPIKAALLDQKIVSGLGNIYVCEVLHRAGLDPRSLAGHLGEVAATALVPLIRDVLSEAIEAGGSSLKDYRQADGELGYFQHRFRVYDREGQPCPRPECTGIVQRIVQSGRSSFFCPACQKPASEEYPQPGA
jgi:formamidopyrimidine-DNA glycosylase